MRRLLHNSGKCLLPKEALEFFSGSLMQQAMIAELESSFDLTPTSVSMPSDCKAVLNSYGHQMLSVHLIVVTNIFKHNLLENCMAMQP